MREIETLLASLHSELAKELLRRIKTQEAAPADLAAAVKFLKDNGIDAMPTRGKVLPDLEKALRDEGLFVGPEDESIQ